ncbi:hypothetical protein [Tabrizicola sp.]|uniref:hypothetical protein n=1 Tax=Tabrizicola sp. TaxID=2005166 RepID=UPI0035B0CB91
MTKHDLTGGFMLITALAGLYGLHLAEIGGWPGAILTGVAGMVLGYKDGKQR